MSLMKDLQKAAESALREGTKVAQQAGRKAGQLAHENREKIDAAIDKASKVIDDKTGGKYTSKIEGVKAQAAKAVDLAEKQGAKLTGHGAAASAGDGTGESAGGPQDKLWQDDGGMQASTYDAAREAAAAKPDPAVGEFGTATGEPGKGESGTSTP